MTNALLTFFDDPKQLELVNTIIQKTQEGKLRWNKSATSYEALLPNGVQLKFILSMPFFPKLFQGKTWAQFIVCQQDGSEIVNVQQSSPLPDDKNPKRPLETAVEKLFKILIGSAKDEVDKVIDQLKNL